VRINIIYAKAASLRRYYPDQVRGVFREHPKSQARSRPQRHILHTINSGAVKEQHAIYPAQLLPD